MATPMAMLLKGLTVKKSAEREKTDIPTWGSIFGSIFKPMATPMAMLLKGFIVKKNAEREKTNIPT